MLQKHEEVQEEAKVAASVEEKEKASNSSSDTSDDEGELELQPPTFFTSQVILGTFCLLKLLNFFSQRGG